MSLRMQLRRIIIWSVQIYLCTCMRNKYPCKSVMLKLISFSILNMHELVETWFLKFQDWQSNVYFPWPNELTICPDLNGFQIPLKTSSLDTDDVKQNSWAKDFFVFCSGKICLVLFQGCCSFVCHLCPVHKINAPTPITTILATHLLHEFIVNVKHRMDWSYRKPYTVSVCRLISGNNILLMEYD